MTLVELICVMLIVSVLSVSAVVRIGTVSTSAHRAGVGGTADAFATGIRLAFSYCQLKSWANKDNLPGFADGTVDFNAACNPVDTNGQNSIANNAQRCVRVWDAILTLAPSVATGGGNVDYRASASNNVCTFTYMRDTGTVRSFTYNSLNGLVVTSNP
jgi:hypothetical protein